MVTGGAGRAGRLLRGRTAIGNPRYRRTLKFLGVLFCHASGLTVILTTTKEAAHRTERRRENTNHPVAFFLPGLADTGFGAAIFKNIGLGVALAHNSLRGPKGRDAYSQGQSNSHGDQGSFTHVLLLR